MDKQTWLWIGCLGMAAGAIIFGIGAHNNRSERWKILLVLNFFIAAIASILYLAMTQNQGYGEFAGRPTFWIRYVTWSLSTPLLVLVLTYLGGSSLWLTGSLVGADVLMIATGFVATISREPVNYLWYVVSCGAYLAIAYLLLGPYRQEAVSKHPRARKVFYRLLTVHLILWTGYPIVWILANTGFNVINSTIETALYTLLDLASKVGFGFLSLNSMKQLEQSNEAPQFTELIGSGTR